MSKFDQLKKPFGMSEDEFQLRLRVARHCHRIYVDTIEHILAECGKLADDERDLVLGGTSVMVCEHLGRILGGPKAMAKEVAEARSTIKALRRKQ